MELQECLICGRMKKCIHHHTVYACDLTFPVCRSCHQKIHLKKTAAYMGYSPIDYPVTRRYPSGFKQLTIKLPLATYAALVKESKSREGLVPAPTRTARQLIEERLKQLEGDN